MIVVIVTFMVVFPVLAGAGVFEIVTAWAVSEVQVELRTDFLSFRRCLYGNDDWKVVSCREGLVRDEGVAVLLERHLDRVFAITSDDIDALLC